VLHTDLSKTDLQVPWDYAIRRFHSKIVSRVQKAPQMQLFPFVPVAEGTDWLSN